MDVQSGAQLPVLPVSRLLHSDIRQCVEGHNCLNVTGWWKPSPEETVHALEGTSDTATEGSTDGERRTAKRRRKAPKAGPPERAPKGALPTTPSEASSAPRADRAPRGTGLHRPKGTKSKSALERLKDAGGED